MSPTDGLVAESELLSQFDFAALRTGLHERSSRS
jgi:hypothetical protein